MKQLKVFYLFAAILFCGIMLSCDDKNSLNDDENGSSGSNNFEDSQIEMKTYPNDKNKIEFYITAKKVAINWGDGRIDELTPNGVGKTFSHE